MPETPRHVKHLIQKAYNERATFLDLGNCGLTEIPEEITMLSGFLNGLNLGYGYNQGNEFKHSQNTGAANDLSFVTDSLLMLNSFPNFKCLYLYQTAIAGKGVEIIARFNNLSDLDIRYNQLTDKEAESIACLSNLTFLDISSNQLTDNGAESIACLSRLTHLYISSNQLSDKGAEAIGRLNNLTHLSIGTNFVTDKGAEAIGGLNRLTWLYIGSNQLSDKGAGAIAQLSNLTWLDISSNQLTDEGAKAIGELNYLKHLYISSNKIADKGAEAIARLGKSLTHLDIDSNQLTHKGAEAIRGLSNLTNLFISNNQIGYKGAEAIGKLNNLTRLYVSNNKIGDKGAEFIAGLSNLRYLAIFDNQITDEGAKAIGGLSNLTSLNIDDNQIGDKGAEAIGRLTKLTYLDISINLITDKGAEAIANLENLTCLYISGNQITGIEAIQLLVNKLQKLSVFYFDNDKIERLPREIGYDVNSLRGYFASTKKIPNNLVKMILIGNTTAGKSSLADFLVNKQYDSYRESTHGIQLWRWKTSEEKKALQVNIWDFGGQDYYHATHNLFLDDKTIFVLLHTSKDVHDKTAKEKQENQWLPINYWLGNIRDIAGSDCPAWFIASKADAGKTNPPDSTLGEIYNVSEEFSISVKQTYEGERKAARDFNSFCEDLINELNKLKGDELPVSWVKIRDVYLPAWRNENSKFFTKEEFRSRCEDALNGDFDLLDIIATWDGLLLYLKGCGEVVYFDDNAALSDIIFLSAEKLTKDIYDTILAEEVRAHHGIIDINKIIAGDMTMIQKYIEVLVSFGLIFKKTNSDNLYVAPQYLPENPSEKMIREIIPLTYVIHFSDYMSRSLITKFIVKYASQERENNYWRYGVNFKKYGLNIFGRVNSEEQKIYVHIQPGAKPHREQLMEELFLFFTKIAHKKDREDEIRFGRKVELIKANTELSTNDIDYVRVQEISLAIKSGSSKVRATHGGYIDVNRVFSLLINEGTIIPKKIFFSYAHEDEKYKEELDKHFSALKKDKKIAAWQDREIKAGDNWDETIKQALTDSDIVVLLLSSDFMASKYIWDVEIPAAVEHGATIVPIFLRPCDFNETVFEIYKKQGLPRDTEWIVTNENIHRDTAYLKVVEGIKSLL